MEATDPAVAYVAEIHWREANPAQGPRRKGKARTRATPHDEGAVFRERHLLPSLRAGRPVHLHLDGASPLDPAFLEETFGGLIRAGIDGQTFARLVWLDTASDRLRVEILGYVNDAVVQRCACNCCEKARRFPA